MLDIREDFKPTIISIMHRPFRKVGASGWGTALYYALKNLVVEEKVHKAIVISAPEKEANFADHDKYIDYRQVNCAKELADASKATAADVFAWDQIHILRPEGEPAYAADWFVNRRDRYEQGMKDFFLYSLATATSALENGYDEIYPIFQLNDPHDSFVSAFFEGNVDEEWLLEKIGQENAYLLDNFKLVKEKFIKEHQEINHMRFWHVPSIDIDSFDQWFEVDPKMAIHFLAGVFSSPLCVHASMWKDGFDKLFEKYKDIIVELIPNATLESINNGVGVGPIGYDPGPFLERFKEYDGYGRFRESLDLVSKWSEQFSTNVVDGQPVIFTITFRADDPKNNGVETARALKMLTEMDPEVRKNLCVMAVFNSSRVSEDPIYEKTLNEFKYEMSRIADDIGTARVVIVEQLPFKKDEFNTAESVRAELVELVGEKNAECFTQLFNGDSNLPHQAAMFIMANAFICAARGGFDVVGAEALMVAALRAAAEIDPLFILELRNFGLSEEDFHLIMADTAGSSKYLNNILPNFSMIRSSNSRMPRKEEILPKLQEAYESIMQKRSIILPNNEIVAEVEKVCSASECLSQWISAALVGSPQSHPRTLASVALTDGTNLGLN